MHPPPRRYAHVAWCYDELATLWSLGAIPRAKAAAARALTPGSRCLFAGVGRGADALIAAHRGVEVVALDAEPAMLARFRRALERSGFDGSRVETIETDWLDHAPSRPYDAVVASFSLNVFGARELAAALDALLSWLRPGGVAWVVDFAPPRSSTLSRLGAALHYWPVAAVAAALGLCALHPIYDYGPLLEARGMRRPTTRDFGRAGLYRLWRAECGRHPQRAAGLSDSRDERRS